MEWWTESEAKAFWKKSDIEGEEVAERERLAAETFAGWERRMAEDEKADQERGSDFYAIQANEFRNDWITTRSRNYGSFEDTTKIPPMRFTDKAAPPYTAYPCDSLQVFSAKVAGIKGDLHWPLRVFGMVALRDCVDYNRNVIFHRTRDNYQTLTEKDPYLVLTGPTRAVMWLDTVTIEAMLKVKGTVESEDRDLSVLAVPIMRQETLNSYLFNRGYTSILGTLEFTLGHIVYSVEATIFVRIIDGSWTDGFHGLFAASSSTFAVSPGTFVARTPSIDHKKIVLLYSKDEKIVLTDDGNIKLSRSVASVEIEGELKVSVKAWAASGGANNDLECVLACTTNGLAATGGDHNALEGELVESGGAIEAASGGANNDLECVLACTTNELAASGGYHNALQGELVESGGAIGATEGELTASTDDNNVMKGELAASHHAYNNVVEDESVFTPKENGRSYGTLDIGFCKMEVTVAWSLVSAHG